MGNIIRKKKKNNDSGVDPRFHSPSPPISSLSDDLDALPPPLTWAEMMEAQIAVLEAQWAKDVEDAHTKKEDTWWSARGDVLLLEQEGIRQSLEDEEEEARHLVRKQKFADAQNLRLAKGAAQLEAESAGYRKMIEQEESAALREIVASAFDEREEIMDVEVEHSAARVIQRNFRVAAARHAARRFIVQSRHSREVQLWANVKLAQLLCRHKQMKFFQQLEILAEEKEARGKFVAQETFEWDELDECIKSGDSNSRRRQWARTKEERDAQDREDVQIAEKKARNGAAEEETVAFTSLQAQYLEELKICIETEQQRRQAEKDAKLREEQEAQHKTERDELEEEETTAREAVKKEEDKAWWMFPTKEPASRSAALHDYVKRVVTEQKQQREELCTEEETARREWVDEEWNEWAALEKLGAKEFGKGTERQALREEIERLRVEQEYEYIRNLFIVMAEEEEWDNIEDEGYKERTDIQEREWKKLMDTQAAERFSVEEDEEKERIPKLNEEMMERSKIYRSFTRSFLKLPYQDFLTNQDVNYEPTLFVSPGKKPKTTSQVESQRSHGQDKGFAVCLRQGVHQWRLPEPPSPQKATPPHRDQNGKVTLPPPRPPAKASSKSQTYPGRRYNQQKMRSVPIPRFDIPHPPAPSAKAIPPQRRNRTAAKPDQPKYRDRLVASMLLGQESHLDPASDTPPPPGQDGGETEQQASASAKMKSWYVGGRLE
eukprot:TRINITY_DN94362_c0_g1_i1.p1 TRINITY_DN94362_c0_g1~~TRINITY_DN94362_c0_g1_i1.p1  ORF type:complete len:720 (+),score=104.10 TRINITY_DN94362_c0_g1_i1:84-2243(+)